MNAVNQALIDAIARKAEQVCPGSLALIGLYGSAATGDVHPKSDLDLLILIEDVRGRQLADTFILDDAGIGYDLYCTTWEMLDADAECGHAHLAKLLDSKLVYVAQPAAVQRLKALQDKANALLASDARREKARRALDAAKMCYADCALAESLTRMRTCAGGVIHYLLDAVMLWHGRYFRKGVKRTFAELADLALPFDMEGLVMAVVQAETADTIRRCLTDLLRTVQAYLIPQADRSAPEAENLRGTYEEMFSNWRNKMHEAADRDDLFSSFMSMVSCQFMLQDIAAEVDIPPLDLLAGFDPQDLQKNAAQFDRMLEQYLAAYQQAGIVPRHFADLADFLAAYLP